MFKKFGCLIILLTALVVNGENGKVYLIVGSAATIFNTSFR